MDGCVLEEGNGAASVVGPLEGWVSTQAGPAIKPDDPLGRAYLTSFWVSRGVEEIAPMSPWKPARWAFLLELAILFSHYTMVSMER